MRAIWPKTWWKLLRFCLIIAAAGCNDPQASHEQQATSPASQTPRPAVTLQIVVIEDPPLAANIEKLRGEWNERTGGGKLIVSELTLAELASETSLAADLVVYPSRLLGTLVEQVWLRPLRDSVLQSQQFDRADLLPAIGNREITYGGKLYAFPLGSPPLLLCVNPTLLEAAGCQIPHTWEEYQAVIVKLKQQNMHCIPPLAGSAAAFTLLARGVSYALQAGHADCLFDYETFQPQIATPPFVRALEELVEELRLPKQTSDLENFQTAVQRVVQGQSAMTLSWPGAYCPSEVDADLQYEIRWCPLPRATHAYRTMHDRWEVNRDITPTTWLGAAGRLVSVTTSSRNAVSAFKLLSWIGSGETAIDLSTQSQHTAIYRYSQQSKAGRWQAKCPGLMAVDLPSSTIAKGTLKESLPSTEQTVFQALTNPACYLLPRIPGIDQYLESLASAVRQAVAGESAATMLQQAADDWNIITDTLGRQQQQLAYRAHLND